MTPRVCSSALLAVALLTGPLLGGDAADQRGAPRDPQAFTSAHAILESVPATSQVSTNAPLDQERLVDAPEAVPGMPERRLEDLVPPQTLARGMTSVALFAAVSLVPVALLVLTAFVRISVVLLIARQALGSPQIPGNQAMTALALLLTVLVMAPVALRVHDDAIAPYSASRLSAADAWKAGTSPIKVFMVNQIIKSKHQNYLWTFYDHAVGKSEGRAEPSRAEDFPLRAVAPAFLVSELTTALYMGFAIYLPFLVVDLVVAAVLSAMGLYLMPPPLVALPLKLVLFVLADGWMLVADMLLRSFQG